MNKVSFKGQPWFRVGDLVTRDGTDIHRVTDTNGSDEYPPDLIDVVCVKAPDEKWTEVGDTECNCANRYCFAGTIIENDGSKLDGKR